MRLVSPSKGTWSNAVKLPGTAGVTINGGHSEVNGMSCATAYCVADEVNGTWGSAIRLPGPASTGNNSGAHAACWSPGNCTAGGAIITSGHLQALVATETSG